MKRTALIAIMLCLWTAAFAQNGVIAEMSGTVELKTAGSTEFVHAKIGDSIAPNTIVSTGFKSTAMIKVGSATIVARHLTRLTLSEIADIQGTETVNMNLQAGRVRVDVKPPAGTKASFTVQSPHATASVRGTEFEQDTRTLSVSQGSVQFQGASGAATMVYSGSESRVSMDSQKVADPVTIATTALLPPPPVGIDASAPVTATEILPPGMEISVKFE